MVNLLSLGQKQSNKRLHSLKTFSFKCESCGKIHHGAPYFAYHKPMLYFYVPPEERTERVELTSDWCIIDEREYLIRSLLEVPIEGEDRPFTWGLWVSLSKDSFRRYMMASSEERRGAVAFGWLAVTIPQYDRVPPDMPVEQLACDVKWPGKGKYPLIQPHECTHPLYHDYIKGISRERAIEIATACIHRS